MGLEHSPKTPLVKLSSRNFQVSDPRAPITPAGPQGAIGDYMCVLGREYFVLGVGRGGGERPLPRVNKALRGRSASLVVLSSELRGIVRWELSRGSGRYEGGERGTGGLARGPTPEGKASHAPTSLGSLDEVWPLGKLFPSPNHCQARGPLCARKGLALCFPALGAGLAVGLSAPHPSHGGGHLLLPQGTGGCRLQAPTPPVCCSVAVTWRKARAWKWLSGRPTMVPTCPSRTQGSRAEEGSVEGPRVTLSSGEGS